MNRFNAEDRSTYITLMKATIGDAIGLNGGSDEIDLLERRIDALNKRMISIVNDCVAKDGNAPAEGAATWDDPQKHTVYPKRQTAQEP